MLARDFFLHRVFHPDRLLPPDPSDEPARASDGSAECAQRAGVAEAQHPLTAHAADGTLLTYRSWPGAGPAVINPLGYGVTLDGVEAAGQRDFLAAMSAGALLATYEQRGVEQPSGGSAARGWEQRGADLWAVADAAGIERAVLYGVFDGGHTIAHGAAQQPERVLGLIFNFVPPTLVAGSDRSSGLPPASFDAWFSRSADAPHGHPYRLLRALGINQPDAAALVHAWKRTARPELVAAHEHLFRNADLRPLLPALTAPALVIEPRGRPLVHGWGSDLAARLPNAGLVRPARGAEMLGAMHSFLATLAADMGCLASRLPPALAGTFTTSEHQVGALRRIVVPVVGDVPSGRAVEVACRLGEDQGATIVLAHIVTVPRTQPLDQPAPEAVIRGIDALRLGEAIAARHRLPFRSRLVPARSTAFGIVDLAKDEHADLIVMADQTDGYEGDEPIGATVQNVARHAPCELLVAGRKSYERA